MRNAMSKIKILCCGFIAVVCLYACSKSTSNKPTIGTGSGSGNGNGGGNGSSVPIRPTTPYVTDSSFKTVAYYYDVNDPSTIDISVFPLLTHINYSFIYPNKNGSLNAITQTARFNSIAQLATQYKIKKIITVGGQDSIFTSLASAQSSRTYFTQQVLQFVLNNNFDGVDIDWEYPSTAKGTDVTFASLIHELSDSLHAWHKSLSIAVTPALYAGAIRDAIGTSVINDVDFLNIMIYDGIGWDPQNKNNHSTYNMLVSSLNIWKNTKGLPGYKAVAGIPFYGKNASNTAMSFRSLVNAGANPAIDSFNMNGVVYYYNGIQTIKAKTTYAKANANGIMFWELSQDISASPNSLVKAAYGVLHP